MADQKTTALSAFTPVLSDILYGVDDPGGTPVSGKVTLTAIRDLLQANFEQVTVNTGSSGGVNFQNSTQLYSNGANDFKLSLGGGTFGFSRESVTTGALTLGAAFRSNTFIVGGSNVDVRLQRDAAATLALRNGTNAQTFNIYNTFTDASNGEWGGFRWNSNVLEIRSTANGTGTARPMSLTPADIRMPNLPTADPTVAGQLWNDTGTLKVSAG